MVNSLEAKGAFMEVCCHPTRSIKLLSSFFQSMMPLILWSQVWTSWWSEGCRHWHSRGNQTCLVLSPGSYSGCGSDIAILVITIIIVSLMILMVSSLNDMMSSLECVVSNLPMKMISNPHIVVEMYDSSGCNGKSTCIWLITKCGLVNNHWQYKLWILVNEFVSCWFLWQS